MRRSRLLVAATLVSVLASVPVGVLGLAGAAPAVAAVGAGAGATGDGRVAPVESTRCARLAERAAEIPGIRARIKTRIDAIEERIAAVTVPARRARVAAVWQPRIDALRALDGRLAAEADRVAASCPSLT